jgi:hypothetical protein
MSLPRRPIYALSLRQPWAALVVAGKKTIEVRTWATSVRGRVLIHAAQIRDDRVEAWAAVGDDIRAIAEVSGGIIGSAELTACVRYLTPRSFAADAARHLNDPSWFEPPRMFGFVFRGAAVVPFVPLRGKTRFFTIEHEEGS